MSPLTKGHGHCSGSTSHDDPAPRDRETGRPVGRANVRETRRPETGEPGEERRRRVGPPGATRAESRNFWPRRRGTRGFFPGRFANAPLNSISLKNWKTGPSVEWDRSERSFFWKMERAESGSLGRVLRSNWSSWLARRSTATTFGSASWPAFAIKSCQSIGADRGRAFGPRAAEHAVPLAFGRAGRTDRVQLRERAGAREIRGEETRKTWNSCSDDRVRGRPADRELGRRSTVPRHVFDQATTK